MKREIKKGELLGICLIGAAVFLFVSLISYNPNDPSFRHISSSKDAVPSNYSGIVGGYTSDIFMQLLGGVSYPFSVLILLLGIDLCINKRDKLGYTILFLGGLSFCIFSSSFIYMINDGGAAADTITKHGGITGYLTSTILLEYFGKAGTYIVVLVAISSSILLTLNLSVVTLSLFIYHRLINIFNITKKISSYLYRFAVWIRERNESKNVEPDAYPAIDTVSIDNKTEDAKIVRDDTLKKIRDQQKMVQEQFKFMETEDGYNLPPLSLLNSPPPPKNKKKQDDFFTLNSNLLEKKLKDFGVEGRVTQVIPGPVITRYEYEPASGVKVSKIMGLSDDLALGMKALSIRILAPVPGKAVVGIEIPNIDREPIHLKEILLSDEFKKGGDANLFIALGKNISGDTVVTDLAQIPHLLVAGATGSGKSVGINSMICSLLFTKTPEELNFLMIDPKRIELSIYDGIAHLVAPVVIDPKKAASALRWVVVEMEKRYELLAEKGVKNIDGYNKLIKKNGKKKEPEEEDPDKEEPAKLPYIVVVIDELADLMMVASKDVETYLTRLAQMARAAGIHLLVATQRPSVDVLTGIIKANFPARISFQVTSRVDSRTILDSIGSEKLLGKGDMLFLTPGTSKLNRIHGPLVTEDEIKRVVDFVKKQRKPVYENDLFKINQEENSDGDLAAEYDEKYDEAVAFVSKTGQASISLVQRRFKIGYNRAARIIEQMEKEGVVGPSDGVKPRRVLVKDI